MFENLRKETSRNRAQARNSLAGLNYFRRVTYDLEQFKFSCNKADVLRV